MNSFDPDHKKTTEPSVAAALKQELEPDERLLWSGQPIASRVFRVSFIIYLFAIPWTAFALFWEAMAAGSIWGSMDKMPDGMGLAMGIVFPLFGLPFIAIGFWMLAKPFSIRRMAANTIFAVTSKRALIFTKGAKKELRSFPYENMQGLINRKEEKDGSGSLIFSLKSAPVEIGRGSGRDTDPFARGFEYIPNVREAETALRRAMDGYVKVNTSDNAELKS